MYHRLHLFALPLVLMLLVSTLSWADDRREEQIHFAPGKSGATLKRAIARGETLNFLLDADKGQTMTVSVRSVESNAVFQVFSDGGPMGHSKPKDGAQVWSGKLPIKGTYAIEVGSERGGAEFTLDVTIR